MKTLLNQSLYSFDNGQAVDLDKLITSNPLYFLEIGMDTDEGNNLLMDIGFLQIGESVCVGKGKAKKSIVRIS